MSYSVFPTPDFKKFFKKLAKKHPSLKADLQELTKILKEQPDSGIYLGHGIHKIHWPLPLRVKESLAVQGLSLIL